MASSVDQEPALERAELVVILTAHPNVDHAAVAALVLDFGGVLRAGGASAFATIARRRPSTPGAVGESRSRYSGHTDWVRTDPKILLRGLAKLVVPVLAAGVARALIGIDQSKLRAT